MSRWYRILYGMGFTPWEQDADTLAPQFRSLIATVERKRKPPHGAALDLGCGTGRWSVELAQRGWAVVGVDVVPKAVHAAQRRAESVGVDVRFVEGDVTTLRSAGVGSGFSFILDVECFNHLSDSQREAVGREVDAVAAADASLLLLVWRRARRGPLPPGASRADLEKAFPAWRIDGEWPYEGELPGPLKSATPRWYLLSRA